MQRVLGNVLLLQLVFVFVVRSDTIPVSCQPGYDSYDFCNVKLPVEQRVNNLISLLTIQEKAYLLSARQSPLNFVERLGIAEFDWVPNHPFPFAPARKS